MAKGHEFTLEQKQEIIQYRETVLTSGGKITNRALTAWANAHFQVNASEMNIGRIIKRKEHFSGLDVGHLGDSKRLRKSQCPEVEEATFTWFTTMQENNVAISDDLVVAATKRFYALLPRSANEKELQFSHGWVQNFKKRYNIKGYTRHGEDASADVSEEVLKKMEDIKTLVSQYRSCDVFNMDETGLFYRLEPNRTLATKRLSGKKKQKERITVALTANADGSIILPPLVINQYLKPRAFTSRHILNPENLGIQWYANKKAWMTTQIFEQFMLYFERRMVSAQKEKVLLLVDNFSGHQVPNVASRLRVTRLEFLPPNTTSRFQPMDAGIIASFKAQYKKLLIQHQIDCISIGKSFVIDVYEAVTMLEKAWRNGVTPTTIQNCWRHTRILSVLVENEVLQEQQRKEIEEVATVLEQLSLISSETETPNMNAQEYLNYELEFDLNNPYQPTDEEIIEMLPSQQQGSEHVDSDPDEANPNDVVEEVVSFKDVGSVFQTLKKFLEQRPNDTMLSIRNIEALEKEVESWRVAQTCQSTIDSFFQRT
jgi:hypothetical protein